MHGYRISHGGDLNENDNFMCGNSSYMVTKNCMTATMTIIKRDIKIVVYYLVDINC